MFNNLKWWTQQVSWHRKQFLCLKAGVTYIPTTWYSILISNFFLVWILTPKCHVQNIFQNFHSAAVTFSYQRLTTVLHIIFIFLLVSLWLLVAARSRKIIVCMRLISSVKFTFVIEIVHEVQCTVFTHLNSTYERVISRKLMSVIHLLSNSRAFLQTAICLRGKTYHWE